MILYSFRRCPYAMRARMMLIDTGVRCEVREVRLANKPQALLEASPKGTVPVLCLSDGRVLEESLDIMLWAVQQREGQSWWSQDQVMREAMTALIRQNDHDFKYHLDRYKYPQRFGIDDVRPHWQQAVRFLTRLESRLQDGLFLFGQRASLADVAIFPFVRQFAAVDRAAFDAMPYQQLQHWLQAWQESEWFAACMQRFVPWQSGDAPVYLF